jgi:hypothetical protein
MFDDYRRPVIAALCKTLGLPLAAVAETAPGHYAPAVAIDLYPFEDGNGTITYRAGLGRVMVRRGRCRRLGVDAAVWDPPMVADDETVCAALAEAHRRLLGADQCENRGMNYPTYSNADNAKPDESHPAIRTALRGFEVEHLPGDLRPTAQLFRNLALTLAEELPSDPETTIALRKLVEAKDCAVRAIVFNRPPT